MSRYNMLKQLRKYIELNKGIKLFILLGICSILSVIYPFIYKFFIDKVLLIKDIKSLKYVVVFILVWLIIYSIVKKVLGKTKADFLTNSLYKIKNTLLERILDMNLTKYNETNASEFKRVIEDDSKEIESFLSFDIFDYLVYLITICLLIIMMLFLSPVLLFSCMVFFVISFLETNYIKKKVLKNSEELRDLLSCEDHMKCNEVVNYKEIKCLNREEDIAKLFEKRASHLNALVKKENVYQYINKYLGALNHDLITRFFIYIVGGMLIIKSDFTTSSFLVFLGFYEVFVKNVRKIIESNFSYNNKRNKLENIIKYLIDHKKITSNNKINNLRTISLDNVSFKYNESRNSWIFQNYSNIFSLPNVYLIQGQSGMGKSTILKLLFKEQTDYKGNIYFNDIELSTINPDERFYNLFAIASSDSKIFNTNIRDNLLLVNENATDDQLEEVCRESLFWEDVENMPNGLDSDVGEDGAKLSGGQKERLIMARLFLSTDAQVYILDEALAEISINDEVSIIDRLQKNNKNSIIFIVSHRLQKLNNAKEIAINN